MKQPVAAGPSLRSHLIEEIMRELSPLQRDIVRLMIRFDEEMPDEQIAERHGVEVGRVMVERSPAACAAGRSLARMKIHGMLVRRDAAAKQSILPHTAPPGSTPSPAASFLIPDPI